MVTIDGITTIADVQVLFHQAVDRAERLENELNRLRHETDQSVRQLQTELQQARLKDRMSKVDLIDMKTMAPTTFEGKTGDSTSYRQWGKKMKAYCNAKLSGYRDALEASLSLPASS